MDLPSWLTDVRTVVAAAVGAIATVAAFSKTVREEIAAWVGVARGRKPLKIRFETSTTPSVHSFVTVRNRSDRKAQLDSILVKTKTSAGIRLTMGITPQGSDVGIGWCTDVLEYWLDPHGFKRFPVTWVVIPQDLPRALGGAYVQVRDGDGNEYKVKVPKSAAQAAKH